MKLTVMSYNQKGKLQQPISIQFKTDLLRQLCKTVFGLTILFSISMSLLFLNSCNSEQKIGSADPRQTPTMAKRKTILKEILNLSTTEFFQDSFDFSDKEFDLLDYDYEGVTINAPAVIDIDEKDSLPVAMAMGETSRRQWEVYRGKNLALFALQVNTDAVFIGPASPPPLKEPAMEPSSRQAPEPEETAPYAMTASVEMLDAKEQLNLPWKPGQYSLVIVNYDWVSNITQVELTGEGDPEEAEPLSIKPEPAIQPIGGIEFNLPCYEELASTPGIQNQGVVFQVPSQMAASNHLPVFGTYSIVAQKRYIDSSGIVHKGSGGKKLSVTAVVPMTLLIFGLDWKVPKRFDWAVPVYGSIPVIEGGPLTGYFAIDALEGSDVRLAAGQYAAYIICGSKIYGPKIFNL